MKPLTLHSWPWDFINVPFVGRFPRSKGVPRRLPVRTWKRLLVGCLTMDYGIGRLWDLLGKLCPNHRIWRGTIFSDKAKSPGTWFYGENHYRTWISWIFHGLSREDQRLLIDWLLNSGTSWSGGSFSCWMSTNSALQSSGWTYIL